MEGVNFRIKEVRIQVTCNEDGKWKKEWKKDPREKGIGSNKKVMIIIIVIIYILIIIIITIYILFFSKQSLSSFLLIHLSKVWGILIPQGIENGGVGSTLIRGFAWTDPCILKWNKNKVVNDGRQKRRKGWFKNWKY